MRKSSSSTRRSTTPKDSNRSYASGSKHETTTNASSAAPSCSTSSHSSGTDCSESVGSALKTEKISTDSSHDNEAMKAALENYFTGQTAEERDFKYDVESITPKRVKIDGKWETLMEIKWKDTLMLTHDVVITDREQLRGVPYGLTPEDRNLVIGSDMNKKFTPQPGELYCKHCQFRFLEKEVLELHEREDCEFPGGPKHVCISSCPKDCLTTQPHTTEGTSEDRTDEKMPKTKKKKRV